jgi:hypothetical protein
MLSQITSKPGQRVARMLAGVFAMLLVASTAWLQEITGTINGIITDPSGGAVAGAKVTAKDLDRGTAFPTSTDGSGFYNLTQLPVGRYEVRVENPGFQSALQSPIVLQLNQVAKLDFQLKVATSIKPWKLPPQLRSYRPKIPN